ncbi:MAG: tRNA 2-thiocytidine biosynthesis protein TtcA [Firmicutes bacterium]|nr:tRNA 2-thiocytidine biosynthesis protein TtcA [Bacillota bacterium]
MEKYKEVERSIIKKFRKDIWSRFMAAISDYNLIKENDKIMVCISGGKDSFLLAKCIQELKRHGNVNFEAYYVAMDPGYNEENHNLILENAKMLNIPIEIFKTDIFGVASKLNEVNPCYMCARMRRGYLYSKAEELGCNKIALGHHFDDVIETTLLSMFYGAEIKTMLPKLYSDNYQGLELIRPLYLVKEDAINAWKNFNELKFLNCACKFTEKLELDETGISKRQEMKKLIRELRKERKNIDNNIFTALNNINMNCILGYKKDGKYTSFLDNYEK